MIRLQTGKCQKELEELHNLLREAYYKQHPIEALANTPAKIAGWSVLAVLTVAVVAS